MIKSRKKRSDLMPAAYQEMAASCKNLKYRVILLMMLDCGARPGEATKVKIKDLDFSTKKFTINSLKKRGEEHTREVIMSERLLDAFATYWKEVKIKTPDSYIFPANTEKGYSKAKQIGKWMKRNGYPFAVRLLQDD